MNLATVLIPISFGYAIIKHHVFDITFVVRRGLQYLLAKNALRFLLALPIAGLVYGVLVHRDQPIGQLLWTNSRVSVSDRRGDPQPAFQAAADAVAGSAVLSRGLRSAADPGRVDRQRRETRVGVERLEAREPRARGRVPPASLFVWYREGDKPNLTLSYSSGGYIHAVELAPASPLLQLAERASSIIELPLAEPTRLPRAEREWLEDAGVRLIVPMIGTRAPAGGPPDAR